MMTECRWVKCWLCVLVCACAHTPWCEIHPSAVFLEWSWTGAPVIKINTHVENLCIYILSDAHIVNWGVVLPWRPQYHHNKKNLARPTNPILQRKAKYAKFFTFFTSNAQNSFMHTNYIQIFTPYCPEKPRNLRVSLCIITHRCHAKRKAKWKIGLIFRKSDPLRRCRLLRLFTQYTRHTHSGNAFGLIISFLKEHPLEIMKENSDRGAIFEILIHWLHGISLHHSNHGWIMRIWEGHTEL